LTPAGTGAIATLALRGPRAWEVVRELFRPHATGAGLPAEAEPGRVWLGRLGEDPKAAADEVVMVVKRGAPAPWVEVHCHGGREVIRMLLEMFAARGIEVCSWQQLESRTATDLLQAGALAALAEARTTRTAAVLLDQYHGAFGRQVGAVRAALGREDHAEAGRILEELTRYAAVGRHLTAPWRVVIAGAPNVGKSSLVNALAGYQRSVVAATPGTTRDVVTTLIAVDGWPVELTDTAGLRPLADNLEQQGIDLARRAAEQADLCLWVLDAATAPVWPDAAAGAVRLVVNKVDLPAAWDWGQAAGAVHVSALTGAGLAELCQAVAGWLVPESPPPDAAVPFTPALCDRVEEARRHGAAGRHQDARRALAPTIEP
jgi:tRNA modification GTPase